MRGRLFATRSGSTNLVETGELAFSMCGDVRIVLTKPEMPEFERGSSIVYFRVDDIAAARAELVDRGVPFEDEPHLIARMPDHELWMTFSRTPTTTCTAS